MLRVLTWLLLLVSYARFLQKALSFFFVFRFPIFLLFFLLNKRGFFSLLEEWWNFTFVFIFSPTVAVHETTLSSEQVKQ